MAFIFAVNLFLLALFTGQFYHEVQGRLTTKDLEMEEQLKIVNKPPLKSIKDESGVLYDCIDILKQPAFDHPLLKDHKIQMKPTWITNEEVPSPDNIFGMIMKSFKCPEGTVPIRRTRKKYLKRANLLTRNHPLDENAAVQNVALAGTENPGRLRMYYGVQATMNIINPTVTDDQASFTFIAVGNNFDGPVDQIQAGWAVDPATYGDHKTHLSTNWNNLKADTGCVDAWCPGFIQVNQKIPLGAILPNVTRYGGHRFEINLRISMDKATKNWWLTSLEPDIQIGYWPASVFSDLSDATANVLFGGAALSSVNTARPPLGLGTFPEENYSHCGYFTQMKVVDKHNHLTGLSRHLKEHTDCRDHYGVKYYGEREGYGSTMAYGGPGGMCGS